MTTDLAAATNFVDAAHLPWMERSNEHGHYRSKLIRCSPRAGTFTVLLDWPAGIMFPKHRHFGPVHGYTLSGAWGYEEYDWVSTTGTYVYEEAGSVHTLRVDEPTVALFVVEGGQVWLGPNDEPLTYHDAALSAEHYRLECAAAGIEVPDGVIVD